MTQSIQMRLATGVIVLVLGVQFIAVVARLDRWSWPFTDYPMYSLSRQNGDRISASYFVTATTSDGQQIEISPEDFGINTWVFARWARQLFKDRTIPHPEPAVGAPDSFRSWLKSTWLGQLLKNKDPDRHSILLAIIERELGVDIIRLQVEDTPYVLTRQGAKPAPPMVVVVDVD